MYPTLELDYNKLLDMVSEMGYRLMKSGAEIYRVEESIQRLLQAYGAPRGEVFAIPNCLMVSLTSPDGRPVTQIRRMPTHGTDMTAAAQAAIRFNEAVEELEAGYEGTALTTGDLEKYYRMAEDFLSRCGASETIEPQKKAEDEAPRRQKSQKSGSTSRKRQSGGNRAASGRGTSGRSRNTSGRNSRSRQNMQTTARRKKRQRTQSRALTVVLLAVVLLGLLVRAWTMGLMK